MGKAAEITSLELHHESQLASTWSIFESRKSQWEAAQTALKVAGENTVAGLHAKIAQLDQQVSLICPLAYVYRLINVYSFR